MHCPFCQHEDTRVIDSRLIDEGQSVRRRRECPQCSERFNTYERVELRIPLIAKSDARRESFDERKLRSGIELALQKRPVTGEQIDAAIANIVRKLRAMTERELPSRRLGELVMHELKRLDQVAYVRFASVYRRFEDVQAFREEIEQLERDLPVIEGRQLSLLEEEQPGTRRRSKSAR
jgi:transcriptional repressor NrdR